MSETPWHQRPSAFLAVLSDSWRETRDSKVLYVLLGGIALLLGVVLTANFEPLPGSKQYLQLAARACGIETSGLDLAKLDAADLAGRLKGALYSLDSSRVVDDAEDLPGARWLFRCSGASGSRLALGSRVVFPSPSPLAVSMIIMYTKL